MKNELCQNNLIRAVLQKTEKVKEKKKHKLSIKTMKDILIQHKQFKKVVKVQLILLIIRDRDIERIRVVLRVNKKSKKIYIEN